MAEHEIMKHDPLAWLLGDMPEPEPRAAPADAGADTHGAASRPAAAEGAGVAPQPAAAGAADDWGAALEADAGSEVDASPAADATPPAALGETGVLVLAQSLTVDVAAELKGVLLPLLDGREEVHLDAGGVERVDGAGLQLLAAFCTTLERRGGRVAWEEVSGALVEAARVTGLAAALRLP